MREIVFDTETTGFGVEEHRIIEFGAVELINRLPTGRTLQFYFNPERAIDFGATRVHGITDEKVKNAPRFGDVWVEVAQFVGEAQLVAHNAEFDISFLTAELARLGLPPLTNPVVDTLLLARRKLPGQRHTLDALCRHYEIDLSGRTFHGALLDAQLLADVYVELTGGLQTALTLEAAPQAAAAPLAAPDVGPVEDPGVVVAPTEDDLSALAVLRAKLKLSAWPGV